MNSGKMISPQRYPYHISRIGERSRPEVGVVEVSKNLREIGYIRVSDLCEFAGLLGQRSWVNIKIRAGEPLNPRQRGQ